MRTAKKKRKNASGFHPSHRMTPWESTIITITCTPRFGRIRECRRCGIEQAETVTGRHTNGPLTEKCEGSE